MIEWVLELILLLLCVANICGWMMNLFYIFLTFIICERISKIQLPLVFSENIQYTNADVQEVPTKSAMLSFICHLSRGVNLSSCINGFSSRRVQLVEENSEALELGNRSKQWWDRWKRPWSHNIFMYKLNTVIQQTFNKIQYINIEWCQNP